MTNKRYQIIGIITGTLAVVISFLTFLFGEGVIWIKSPNNETVSKTENQAESDDLTNTDKTIADSSNNAPDDESTSTDGTDASGSNIEQNTSDRESASESNAPSESIETTPSDMVVVPNVVGMKQDEATRLIEENGLQFQVWWIEGDAESEPYYICEQSTPEGSIVAPGTLVRLQLTSTRP